MMTPEIIEKFWPLKNVIIGKLIKQSGERIVGEFRSENQTYIYKIAPSSRSFVSVQSDLETLSYLQKLGFHHLPKLIAMKNGESCVEIGNQAVYILKKVEGLEPEDTAESWKQLGLVTARLHNAPIGPVSTSFTQAETIQDLLLHSAKFPFQQQYDALLTQLPYIEDFPKSIIHTDIGVHNAIFNSDGKLILLDWDDAGNGVRLLDIAFPLICAFYNDKYERFQYDKAEAYYAAYSSLIGLTHEEINTLFDTALFYALMYMEYGDIARKWERLQNALAEREQIEMRLKVWLK